MAQSKFIQAVKDEAKGRPRSTQWYRDKIKEFGKPTTMDLIRDGKRDNKPFYGKLNMFIYDPKFKKKLPYYDTFPLTVCIRRYPTGFLGLNLHYIAPRYRAILMDGLYDFFTDYEGDYAFNIRYPAVKSVSRLRWAKPCLKRYFYRNVNSRIVEVQPEHMDFVTLLPSQRFRTGVNFNKFSALDVYRNRLFL